MGGPRCRWTSVNFKFIIIIIIIIIFIIIIIVVGRRRHHHHHHRRRGFFVGYINSDISIRVSFIHHSSSHSFLCIHSLFLIHQCHYHQHHHHHVSSSSIVTNRVVSLT